LLRRLFLAAWLLALHGGLLAQSALNNLQLGRDDESLRVSYQAKLELPRSADDALHKGVPLYFVAEAQLTRKRWYWRDAVVARQQRQWRISYQPLSRQYRLSTGGLHQSFDTLAEALAPLARASGWPLELREEPQSGASYLLRFSLRLDTSQLPAPLQIGLGSGASLSLERELPLSAEQLANPAP
jgi:hypothetical protein